jgi:hypothetical protein
MESRTEARGAILYAGPAGRAENRRQPGRAGDRRHAALDPSNRHHDQAASRQRARTYDCQCCEGSARAARRRRSERARGSPACPTGPTGNRRRAGVGRNGRGGRSPPCTTLPVESLGRPRHKVRSSYQPSGRRATTSGRQAGRLSERAHRLATVGRTHAPQRLAACWQAPARPDRPSPAPGYPSPAH